MAIKMRIQSGACLFFFQAEDGIRDLYVTGVQTCALPISRTASYASTGSRAFVSADGRTTFVVAYPPPDNEAFGNNTKAAKRAAAALAGDTIAGAPVHVSEIGRASCRERGWMPVGGVSVN